VRIACLVVAVLATAGLGYRALQNEASVTALHQSAAVAEKTVSETAELLLDVRASLHAYVAPGQGLPFWGRRAQEGIGTLRDRLPALEQLVAPLGGSMKTSIDAGEQLAAAERRARTYVSRDEMQIAGDVIFTEVRDLLATMTGDVQTAGELLRRDHDQRAASIRNEQLTLAGGVLAVWVILAMVLLPAGQKTVQDPAQWRTDLKDTLNKPAVSETPKILDPAPVAEPALPVVPMTTLRTVSEICSDLSALADPGALQGALERVNGVLNATGLIVWVATNDGGSLAPVATHGFDPRLVNRIGRIPRDSANLTAAAFRENAAKISMATESAPGAIAVPLCGPTGPAGVLSVELKAGEAPEEAKVALAAIVAAQLATLAMPVQETQEPAIEPQRAAM
jgi:hypothetical protein